MQLSLTDEDHAILEGAVNGGQRYGIATLSEMGIDDDSRIHIVVPNAANIKEIRKANPSIPDSKLHHILCAAISRQATKDDANIKIRLKGTQKLPVMLIQDVTYVCLRNGYIASVLSKRSDTTYFGGFVITQGTVSLNDCQDLISYIKSSRERVQRLSTCILGTKVNWYLSNHHTGQVSGGAEVSKYVGTLAKLISYAEEPGNDQIDLLWYVGHLANTKLVLNSYTKVCLVNVEKLVPLSGIVNNDAKGTTMMKFLMSERSISDDMQIRLMSPPSGTGRLALSAILVNQIISRKLHVFANVRAIKELTENLEVIALFTNVIGKYGLLWHTGCAYMFSSSSLQDLRKTALDSLNVGGDNIESFLSTRLEAAKGKLVNYSDSEYDPLLYTSCSFVADVTGRITGTLGQSPRLMPAIVSNHPNFETTIVKDIMNYDDAVKVTMDEGIKKLYEDLSATRPEVLIKSLDSGIVNLKNHAEGSVLDLWITPS